MNRRKIVFQFLVLALAAALVVSASGPVRAEGTPPQAIALASGESAVLVIPAAAFSSDGFDANSLFFNFSGGYMRGMDVGDGCMKAPVYLPQFARVYEARASVYDNDNTSSIVIDLRRLDNFNGAVTTMATMTTSGVSTSVQTPYDLSVNAPLVLYPDYSYYVTLCLQTANLRLYSVRIWYFEPYKMHLPMIVR